MAAFAIKRTARGRLEASGVLGFDTAADALKSGLKLIDGDACTIDLGNVTEGDSAGLAVLIEWLTAARVRGAKLNYEKVPGQILAIARISDVQDLLADP
jgi:phospholipid transport system transporter-binding protein